MFLSNILYLTFNSLFHCPPRSRPLTPNVRAAWRRRGGRYSSCGTQTFIFPLHFPRRYTPACAKPPVVRSAFESVVHYFSGYITFSSNSLYLMRFQILVHFRDFSHVKFIFGLLCIFERLSLSDALSSCTSLSKQLLCILNFRATLLFRNEILFRQRSRLQLIVGIVLNTHSFFGLHCIFGGVLSIWNCFSVFTY